MNQNRFKSWALWLAIAALVVFCNNEYICHLEGKPPIPVAETVSIAEINGSALLTDALAALTEIGYVEGGESNGEVS